MFGTPRSCSTRSHRAARRTCLREYLVTPAAALLYVFPLPGQAQCPSQAYNVPTRVFDAIYPRAGSSLTLANPLISTTPPASLTMVALGDSVMWGNGLKNPDKFIELAGQRVADTTQRNVQIVSFAHSGANLAYHPNPGEPPSPDHGYVPVIGPDHQVPPGDLNSSYPTTGAQVDCASTTNPTAEIVLLDGCINEVGPTDIALPPIINPVSKEAIEQRVYQFCSTHMKETLLKAKAAFPEATIILVDYYQIVSRDSSILGARAKNGTPGNMWSGGSSAKALRRLGEERVKIEKLKGNPPPSQKIDKRTIQSWSDNSIAFFTTSDGCFRWAIGAAPSDELSNAGTAADPACPSPPAPLPVPSPQALRQGARVFLATVANRPEYAYGAKKKHLWSLPIRILFWSIHGDDMYGVRNGLCKSHYKGDKEFGAREECRVNPIAHPNKDGAKAYACSIVLDPSLQCDPNRPGILDLAWARL